MQWVVCLITMILSESYGCAGISLRVGTFSTVRRRWSQMPNQPTRKSRMRILEWFAKSRSRNNSIRARTRVVSLESRAETRRDELLGAAGDDQFLRGGTERREGERFPIHGQDRFGVIDRDLRPDGR